MTITQVEVRRKSFGETRVTQRPTPPLADGEVLARIDKFALTANNVSYALSGDMIGYWKFFPVEEPWGVVPVWGFADVVESRSPAVKVGERIWGFLPMASDVVIRPGQISDRSFVDEAAHRASLPAIYNAYQRTNSDPSVLKDLENERCILFPLFSTSYLLYDYLIDNDFFGARQVLVGSASSKTGYGLCNLLRRHPGVRAQVIGLTSSRNLSFVRSLGCCDEVLTYDEIASLDGSILSAYVDMSGDGAIVAAIHDQFGANLKLSCAVGATHWGSDRFRREVVATPHNFFFAPGQFLKREQDWGPGEVMRRASAEAARISVEMRSHMSIRHVQGPDAVAAAFRELVANETPPDVGVIGSFGEH
jgi:NADPH:quinone reductase-like Zn-dependent oxidoreductase